MDKTNRSERIFWKIVLICFGLVALSSGLFRESKFWSGYVLDLTGPAWIYMLIRGQYKSEDATFLKIKFSEELALFLVIALSFAIEMMQYFEWYDSTFDPLDFLAYFSGVFVIYLIDKLLHRKG
jgi:hypothetical protein